jgi:hypothetical protein
MPRERHVTLNFFAQSAESEIHWTCILCDETNKTIKCNTKANGYTNLASHLNANQSDWKSQALAQQKTGQMRLESFGIGITKKGLLMYNWIKWIISNDLPFSFVDYEETKSFANLAPTTRQNLASMVCRLVIKVEKTVADHIPQQFGIIIDGWSIGTFHYLGLFACYQREGCSERALLCLL